MLNPNRDFKNKEAGIKVTIQAKNTIESPTISAFRWESAMNKSLSLPCLLTFLVFFALSAFPVPSSAQKLRLICEDTPPMQFKAPDGSLTGLTVEVVQEIQKRVGNTDPIQMLPWARGLKYLNEEPNTVLFTMARTAERNDLYQWVGPVSEEIMGLYAKADSPLQIKSLDDAKKVHAIGVYRDDIRDQYLTNNGFTNLYRATAGIQNYKMLMLGRIDLFASSASEVAGNKYVGLKLAFPLLTAQMFIAVSSGTDPAIVAQWNEALAAMKKDGSFKAIFNKYFPGQDLPGPAITKF